MHFHSHLALQNAHVSLFIFYDDNNMGLSVIKSENYKTTLLFIYLFFVFNFYKGIYCRFALSFSQVDKH